MSSPYYVLLLSWLLQRWTNPSRYMWTLVRWELELSLCKPTHPVSTVQWASFQKKFNSHQLNYAIIEKEALALIWALQHFEVYVVWFMVSFPPFNLDIQHVKGTENKVADAMSRAMSA